MRTTITLEPDVAERIRQASLAENRSQKAIINEALRRGLGDGEAQPAVPPFRIRPIHSAFRSGIDLGKMNQLADELEAEARLEKEVRL
ncbi:MAG: ribbon-helix-helix protein, CopG family [Opitutales bacterium]|nr:ribbon-helix-helix protein, CopG family [Opitutales bacterium]